MQTLFKQELCMNSSPCIYQSLVAEEGLIGQLAPWFVSRWNQRIYERISVKDATSVSVLFSIWSERNLFWGHNLADFRLLYINHFLMHITHFGLCVRETGLSCGLSSRWSWLIHDANNWNLKWQAEGKISNTTIGLFFPSTTVSQLWNYINSIKICVFRNQKSK